MNNIRSRDSLDILDILGLSSKEDIYTNILKFLFDENDDFKYAFLKFLNYEVEHINNIDFFTRRKFKNIIPDIVLVDKTNKFIIVIEVKIFSSEGVNQLKRYNDMLNNIYIETLGISCPSENNCRLYYLTLNDFSSMKNVHNIYWRDLHEHIYNIKFKRDSIHEILFNSLISKLDLLINIPRLDIKNIIKGDGWLYPTNIIINSLDKEFMKRYNMTSSYSFDRNKNSYASTFILRDNDSWISKNEINEDIVGSLDFDFRKSFDFHIEVQINSLEIDNVSNILVHYRFDLHSNPYFTYKQIKSIRKNKGLESETYFDVRQEFINHVKRNIPIAEELEYRRSSKDYLTIFVMDRLYKNDEDLIDFKSDFETTVEKFSDFGNRIVNLFYDF